jgi:hypothetical protein
MNERQTQKIEELRAVFRHMAMTVDEQAEQLGLPRSTAHAVLRRHYKHSGLSAAVIARVLASPHLPAMARIILDEYTAEKMRGLYGHSAAQRRRFLAALQERRSLQRAIGNERVTTDHFSTFQSQPGSASRRRLR